MRTARLGPDTPPCKGRGLGLPYRKEEVGVSEHREGESQESRSMLADGRRSCAEGLAIQ